MPYFADSLSKDTDKRWYNLSSRIAQDIPAFSRISNEPKVGLFKRV